MIEAAVGLLKRAEMERTAFIASLEAAQAEGERSGFFTIEEVEAELDAIIDDAQRRGA